MTQSADSTAAVDAAIAAFADGQPVLIHDFADREGETDIVYPATAVDSDAVARLRNDAGGLICVALSDAVSDAFGLPFLQELVDHPAAADHELAYDERSSFSLTVNHRETFTGITDDDRALTISELGTAAAAVTSDAGYDERDFAAAFRSPGHVHLLRAAPELLADRVGHTELGIALAAAADQPPAVVVCEMLDDETGGARSPGDAEAYADRHGLVYVEGEALLSALAD
ncbi:3,4-dihydroxy-2-butanone-4-phosphate synthase [Halohasta litorea]|uniref:3,4-dihydroxy-2-butanone 4-phosphate synthase n=1 Tax=Halohasta litorea TaxID=869891 RepID=A0ABD6D2F2_9EURY|nr:3,4-dihydroxy-2-butanone-4-phosphate synthase [Halohasta litorea]